MIDQCLCSIHAQQRDHAETMCKELVRQDGSIVPDLNHVDCYCRDVCHHDAPQRVCEREIDVLQYKVRMVAIQLPNGDLGSRDWRIEP